VPRRRLARGQASSRTVRRSIRAADDVLVMLDRLFTSNISAAPSLRRVFRVLSPDFGLYLCLVRRITAVGWTILCLA
jgi:hypothetical protein